MSRRIRSAWWAAVALVLTAGAAAGQQVVDGNKTAPVFTKIGGVNMNDSTGVVWRFTNNGYPYMVDAERDRDYPLVEQLFSGQQLTAGQTYSMTTAFPNLEYTRTAIMLTWGVAVGDTDSVRVFVKVYGTTSANSANWHLWSPADPTASAIDSCAHGGPVAADTAAAGIGRCLQPMSFFVFRPPGINPYLRYGVTVPAACQTVYGGGGVSGAGRMRIKNIPRGLIRMASANAVMLNLTDNAGAPCPFPYIRIEVTNASTGTTMTNVEANVWRRVQ